MGLPQKRSKRSRAFSNSSVDGLTAFRFELDGELMSASKTGSSRQRNVDPGTGRSKRGASGCDSFEYVEDDEDGSLSMSADVVAACSLES